MVEHTIAMINMMVQHYGAENTLAKKFLASIEELQLEVAALATCSGRIMISSTISQLRSGLKAFGNNYTLINLSCT
jgi:hypothetical protein